jgi:serine/threonine-protein kinase TTK/MPS1
MPLTAPSPPLPPARAQGPFGGQPPSAGARASAPDSLIFNRSRPTPRLQPLPPGSAEPGGARAPAPGTVHSRSTGSASGSDDPTVALRAGPPPPAHTLVGAVAAAAAGASARSGATSSSASGSEDATVCMRRGALAPASAARPAGSGGEETLVFSRPGLAREHAAAAAVAPAFAASGGASGAGAPKPRRFGVFGKAVRVAPGPSEPAPDPPAAAEAPAPAHDAAARKRKASPGGGGGGGGGSDAAASAGDPPSLSLPPGDAKRRQSPSERAGEAARARQLPPIVESPPHAGAAQAQQQAQQAQQVRQQARQLVVGPAAAGCTADDETAPIAPPPAPRAAARGAPPSPPPLRAPAPAAMMGPPPPVAARAAPRQPPPPAAAAPRPADARLEDAQRIWVRDICYTKLECVGQGGSSKVYKVMAPNHKIFALKRIRLAGRDAEAAAGFVDEITLLHKLRGKANIIQLVDAAVHPDRGLIFMVLECGDIDLAALLAKQLKARAARGAGLQPEDENFIRLYWQQMLAAVDSIHRERIVHSDLKPANFLVVEGQLKLIDFGIAKAIQSGALQLRLNFLNFELGTLLRAGAVWWWWWDGCAALGLGGRRGARGAGEG